MTEEQGDLFADPPPELGKPTSGCPHCGCPGPSAHRSVPMVASRPDGPDTSSAAGDAVRVREGGDLRKIRRNTHRHRLLWAYRDGGWISDNEAARLAGLDRGRACYWKRTGELRQATYTVLTGTRMVDPVTEALVDLSRITEDGRECLDRLGPPGPMVTR